MHVSSPRITPDATNVEFAPDCGSIELTILIPCLNESETLGSCVTKAVQYLATRQIQGEVLVADNGSTDNSVAIARSYGARVIAVAERGYGAALIAGSLAAKGRFIIMGDADDSYSFSELDPFLESLRSGSELVIGNRFKGGIMPGAMPFKNRVLGNPVLSYLGRLLFRTSIADFHCGLRGYSREAFLRMKLSCPGMEFASEMVVRAAIQRMKISEVPVVLYKDGRSRPPHLRPWRDGWRHLRFMLLLSPRWLFLYPGMTLLAVGGLLSTLLFFGPVHLAGITLDIHTYIYALLMVLLGYQACGIALVAKYYAVLAGFSNLTPRLSTLVSIFRLEYCLVYGALLVVVGALLAISSLLDWWQVGFGNISGSETLRSVAPSAMVIAAGVQTWMLGFMMAVLDMSASKSARLGEYRDLEQSELTHAD